MSTTTDYNYFTRTYYKDGKYYVEEVEQQINTVMPIIGNATVIAVGGNGNFRFIMDTDTNNPKTIYSTVNTANNICGTVNPDTLDRTYYDYSKVIFNIDIESNWSRLYIQDNLEPNSNKYWKKLIELD